MKIGSLFTGYGGLTMATEAVFGGRTVWTSDIDPGARRIIAHRYPYAPNLGDITAINWVVVRERRGVGGPGNSGRDGGLNLRTAALELLPTPLQSDAGPRGGTTGYGLRDWSRGISRGEPMSPPSDAGNEP